MYDISQLCHKQGQCAELLFPTTASEYHCAQLEVEGTLENMLTRAGFPDPRGIGIGAADMTEAEPTGA